MGAALLLIGDAQPNQYEVRSVLTAILTQALAMGYLPSRQTHRAYHRTPPYTPL
jgi:hypothetical protein